MIDWDLSRSHTLGDLHWPDPDLHAVEVSPVDEVRIELPVGRSFESDGETVHDIVLDRRDRLVRKVRIDSHPMSEASAHQLAVRWAHEWGLSHAPLDRRRDGERKGLLITSAARADRIGDAGPLPTVGICHSADDERPALVSLQFYWPD